MASLRVYALLLDREGRARSGPGGACPSAALEPGESPVAAARRALGRDARWLGTVHTGAGPAGPFVVLALASDEPLDDAPCDVPGGAWTLERARALDRTAAPPPEESAGTGGAERRQLTVLFCDMVGSTALSTQVDAEELRERIAAFQATCTDTIARFDGFVARYMGDGLLAYFGYPVAWGDDAERAVRAGLAIRSAVAGLADARVRVGIATGDVVVGDVLGTGAAQERVVVGETPNLAARLQALAQPGEVLLAPATAAIVASAFVLEDAGRHELKGFPQPVSVSRAVRPLRARSDVGELVGRDAELSRLRRAWEAREALVIVGEAGVGKSRLVDAFVARHPGAQRWHAAPWHHTAALAPVVESLREAAADVEFLAGVDAEASRVVRALLDDAPLGSSREVVLSALVRVVRHRTGDAALVVLEDAHWADPTTLALLDGLVGSGVMVLATQRPTGGWSQDQTLALGPLASGEVEHWLARLGIDAGDRASIIERAGGNPLYVQELARLVAAGGGDAIPATLRDVLAARLGRGAARSVARSAAAFGGPFELRHLEAIHPGATDVVPELGQLGVLRRAEDGRFDFAHALLRDAAYDTLLRRDRVAVHGRIADAMVGGDPEQLATHLDLAERFPEAWSAWEAAAHRSASRFASAEAASSLGRALDAARRAGAPPRTLLALGVERAANLRLVEAHEETLAALDTAEQEGAGAGAVPELARLWFMRGNHRFLVGDTEGCRVAHQRSLDLASAGGWAGEEARAWGGMGDAHYAVGHMAAARDAFARCVELSRRAGLDDVLVSHLPMVGLTTFFLGHGDEAEPFVWEAVERMIGGAHRGMLTAGTTLAVCRHARGVRSREAIEQVLPQAKGPLYAAFRAWALSLVALSDDQARVDLHGGLAALGDNRSLGIRAALLARLAALDRDPESLERAIAWIAPPTPVFVQTFAAPHALHAARRLGDQARAMELCTLLEGLGGGRIPWALRVAAWGRGAHDPVLDEVFPP